MAKIHVLQGEGLNTYTVVVHTTTPAGNNAAGMAWVDVLKNSGRAKSALSIGNGAGQIQQAEMNQITNGEIFETVFQWGDDPAWTNAERVADLDLRANQLTGEALAKAQQDLKYFGFTRA